MERGGPIFYGWWIVIAGAVNQAYMAGAFWQGFGAFFDPIVLQFGWSRALTSIAVSIQQTESGIIAPFVGYFIDKYGPRKVMLSGVLVMGGGFIYLSRIDSLWEFYAAFALITLGVAFGTFLVIITSVTNWFVRMRARAMGITMAGTGIGGLLVPVVVWLISTNGWRTSLVIIGIGVWAVGFPVAFVMRSRPEDYGQVPDGAPPGSVTVVERPRSPERPVATPRVTTDRRIVGRDFTVRQAVRSRAFWQMSIAMGFGQLAMSASIHQIPAMTSFGVSRETAALIILGASLISMVGRLGSGFIGDSLDKRRIIALAFACQFIGITAFAFTGSIWNLIVFMVFWGVGWGGSVPVRFALVADYFGRRSFGSIMGLMSTVTTIFGVIGPVLVGWQWDLSGSYRNGFLIIAATVLITIPLVLTMTDPSSDRSRVESS